MEKKSEGFKFFCSKCDTEIDIPGAIMISPPLRPDKEIIVSTTSKYHICKDCWNDLILNWLWEKPKTKKPKCKK